MNPAAKIKILTVVGARPQFVKAAVVSRAAKQFFASEVTEEIIHTGQHYDPNMSDVFFEELSIPKPLVDLACHGGSHAQMTGKMMMGLEAVFLEQKPDCVLVYGDTNSTLAAALTAVKMHIPVAHVEAGLRSFNRRMPEEINRIMTDSISQWLFCPTKTAAEYLANEGIPKARVHLVGDVMLDAVQFYSKSARLPTSLPERVGSGKPVVLVTLHRAENTDVPERMSSIVAALNTLSVNHEVVFPVHPRTAKLLVGLDVSRVSVIEPVGYLEMLALVQKSSLVLTDSGGLQKEAAILGRPCVTMRDETEWVELVTLGVNRIVGADRDLILAAAAEMIRKKIQLDDTVYGNGHAGKKVLEAIVGGIIRRH